MTNNSTAPNVEIRQDQHGIIKYVSVRRPNTTLSIPYHLHWTIRHLKQYILENHLSNPTNTITVDRLKIYAGGKKLNDDDNVDASLGTASLFVLNIENKVDGD
eukprot:gb/GECH01004529.1/.p1 GENE.gb/GECH01004529.1/~~gb/GECH01004529.1/.p1  ORF type:complete len:103 (+),score=8.06 gb/GECH01004529.1/:1-309(+)